jgi:hypothetical protein
MMPHVIIFLQFDRDPEQLGEHNAAIRSLNGESMLTIEIIYCAV